MKEQLHLKALIITLILSLSCSRSKNDIYPDSISFKQNTTRSYLLSDSKKLDLDPIVNLRSFDVMDSLLICLGTSMENDYLIHIYNLNTNKLIISFAREGRGPEEYMQITRFQVSHGRNEIYIHDNGSQNAYIYSIDSLVRKKSRSPIEKITFPRNEKDANFLLGGRPVKVPGGAYRPVFRVDVNNYIQIVSQPLVPLIFTRAIFPSMEIVGIIGYPPLKGLDSTINVIHLQNIFSPRYSYNPEAKRIVIAYNKTDLIEVFDENLNRIVRIHGPDKFFPKFAFESQSGIADQGTKVLSDKASSPFDLVRDIPGSARRAYSNPVAARNGFYVRYSGDVVPLNSSGPEPQYRTIFYFDYKGSLITEYTLDKRTSLFTVDSDEKRLFIKDTDGDYFVYELKK
jgi:hypothetical protein